MPDERGQGMSNNKMAAAMEQTRTYDANVKRQIGPKIGFFKLYKRP